VNTPTPFELPAPAHWRSVDFISDLHLHPGEPAAVQAWQHYLLNTPADAVFILGDLFEVWVGDDAALPPASFAAHCGQALRAAAARTAIHFMHGNRDFLVGPAFLEQAQVRALPDPAVLTFAGARWLLSHGDALCLADVPYQQFRALVRNPAWQAQFLARPLAEREVMARQLREHSAQREHSGGYESAADIDPAAAIAWLRAARAHTLIHGHTHRPAEHTLEGGLRRIVLADWHLQAGHLRAEVLRLTADGLPRRLPLAPA